MDWEPYAGRRVMCIADGWALPDGENCPKAGGVYTIRTINVGVHVPELFLRFYEVVNAPRRYTTGFEECDFHIGAFRPLLERETDISCLEALLRPTAEDIAVVGVEDCVLDIADVLAHK